MGVGYIPVDDPPGTAPLPPGTPVPGLKSAASPSAPAPASATRTAPTHRTHKVGAPKRKLVQRRRSA